MSLLDGDWTTLSCSTGIKPMPRVAKEMVSTIRLRHHQLANMDTVERSAIASEKDTQRRDGDVEMAVGREKDFEARATGK
jgi:hypothetical protein